MIQKCIINKGDPQRSRGRMLYSILLLWALVGLIDRVHGKCSSTPIVDNERSIAYACIHSDLGDLDELSGETEWIEFSVSRFRAIPDDAFRRFPNLRRLSFYNCYINVIEPAAFHGLLRLDWLIFHGTRIHAVRSSWIRYVPNLSRLILNRCGLVHVEPDVFRMLLRLQTLDLRDNDLDCLSVEELSQLTALKTVRIDGNPWLCECRLKMENFFRNRSIVQETECRSPARICTVHRNLQCMVECPPMTIEPINIKERPNHFQTSALTSLDRLPDRTTWIEILGLRIDRLPAYAFFRFGNSLRSLDLRNCSIGAIEPDAFAGLHQLQRLTIVGNRLTAVAAHWFSDLFALRHLVLAHNNIELIELDALHPLAGSLRHLDVRYNRLRCLTLDQLSHLRHLKQIDIVGNPWYCDCRWDLQRYLTDRNVGFEITGRCYKRNEVIEPTDGWQHSHISDIGHVYWTTFEDTLSQGNITVNPIEISTERPPVHRGTCMQDRTQMSQEVYTCSGITSLTELDILPRSVHAIRIILSNDLKTIPTRAFARFDGSLSRLELRDSGIQTIEHRAFVDLYNLVHLSLHGNQLKSVTSEALEGLEKLQHLDLSHNHISQIPNEVFDTVSQLYSLDISENNMNCLGVEYMARKMPYLNSLKVSDNPWSCLCGTKLASFMDSRNRNPYNRESLFDMKKDCYITGVPTTPPTTAVTIPWTTTTEPPSIDFYNETLKGSCDRIAESEEPRYRCMGGNLHLLKNIPRDAVFIEFYEGHLPILPPSSLYNFRKLQELIIRNSGLRTISTGAFRGLDSLERLTIQNNPLTSIEADWFNIEHLERLDLRGNSIRYIAPGAFRNLHRLAYLNLEGNDLQCIYSSDLRDMPNLHIVEFAGNPLKWRCRMDLEQFLESRKIKFVKMENSCEGKKIMRNLLYENRTVELECPPGCSTASNIELGKSSTFFTAFVLFFVMRMH